VLFGAVHTLISTFCLCAEFAMLSGRVERPRVRRTSEYRVSDHPSAIAIQRTLRYAVSPAPPWYILGYRGWGTMPFALSFARRCVGSKAEGTGGGFQVREDEPAPQVGAALNRTP